MALVARAAEGAEPLLGGGEGRCPACALCRQWLTHPQTRALDRSMDIMFVPHISIIDPHIVRGVYMAFFVDRRKLTMNRGQAKGQAQNASRVGPAK